MKKIIFFDIDGTLLYRENDTAIIPADVITQLDRLRAQDFLLFVASGRPKTFISGAITAYDFDGYILCNGAHVEVQGEIISEITLKKELVKELVKQLQQWDCEYILQTKKESYLHPTFTALHNFYLQCDFDIDLLHFDFNEKDLYTKILKIEVSAAEDIKPLVEEYLQGKFNYDSHGTKNAFEIFSTNVTKAEGVKKVLDYLGIERKNSYAFGDGSNDIEMLQLVGNGIAMGNAIPELKAVADKVCGDICDNGLAKELALIS